MDVLSYTKQKWSRAILGRKTKKKLDFVRRRAQGTLADHRYDARVLNLRNVGAFIKSSGETLRLILQEKEIIVLAILQWLTVALGYFAFIQIIDWIPDTLWHAVDQAMEQDQDGPATLVGLVMMAWLVGIVILASYPIGIFNSAMAAVHFMHQAYGFSSIITALSIAQRNQTRIWAFSSADSWITVNAIIDRLPRKNKNRTALDEVLYYAWKLGTLCIIPGLINGKGLIEAGKESLLTIKKHPMRAIGLRFGYSFICWIIGITTYIASAYYLSHANIEWGEDNWLYAIYHLVFIPLVISIGVITVLIRPFFLMGTAKLYTDTHNFDQEHIEDCITTPGSFGKLVFLLLLSYGLFGIIIYADHFGFQDWIETLAAEDLKRFISSK